MTVNVADTEDGDATRRRNLLDALYRRYSGALRAFLLRQRLSRDDVADVVQETYCRVLAADSIDAIKNPKAFLFRTAINLRINSHKHRRLGVEDDSQDASSLDVASGEPGPYRSLNSEQELAIVRAAIDELSPRCREAFVMNRFENMSFPQIAVELDLSVSMIEKHVSHALAHIKARLAAAQATRAQNVARLSK